MHLIKIPGTVKLISIALCGLSWVQAQTDTAGSDSSIDSSRSQMDRQPVEECWDLLINMHFPMPDQRGRFTIERDTVRGTIVLHGSNLTIREGRVDDNHIRFTAGSSGDQALFEGELKNSDWRGSMIKGRRRLSWTASRCRHDIQTN